MIRLETQRKDNLGINKRKIVGGIVVAGLVVLTFIILGLQALTTYNKYLSARNEIQFAVDHPEIVRTVREDYASKSADLDKSYTQTKKEPTADQKLLEEVANQLKQLK